MDTNHEKGVMCKFKEYIQSHPFDPGTSDCETVLEQLYHAYFESHESDPPEIAQLFQKLSEHLETLPIDTNNAMFALICSLCLAYDRKAYIAGLQTGAHLITELSANKT